MKKSKLRKSVKSQVFFVWQQTLHHKIKTIQKVQAINGNQSTYGTLEYFQTY